MPLLIVVGWYGVVGLTGENNFSFNIVLFISAVLAGQIVSYRIMTSKNLTTNNPHIAIIAIVLLTLAFASFTFYPPKNFLFEHMDLMDTGQYGILDNYDELLIFEH
jgi:hypothetical protein